MDSFADFFPDLLRISLLLLAAIALTPLARALRLPGPAAFLAVGIVAGVTDAIPTDALGAQPLEEIGVVALYAVLFQGGLSTGFRAWRGEARSILVLGTVGTALTALALAGFAHYLLGLDWALAALVGVALSPTDPAAVYAMLRGDGRTSRPRVILEGESGFNDPVSISLMVAVVAFLASDDATVEEGVVRFVEEMGIGLAGGLVGAVALVGVLRATPRLEDSLQAVAILGAATVVGAGTAVLHGSGFLAVYVAGLLVADQWSMQDGTHHALPEAAAAVAEPVLFGLLGAVFAAHVGAGDLAHGLVLTVVTIAVVRPLVVVTCLAGSSLSRAERLVVSVGGVKGAVPLLLAGYAALEALPESRRTEAIVLCATAASIVFQGWALAALSSRTNGRSRDSRLSPAGGG
jgi:cell volume regulation protein A